MPAKREPWLPFVRLGLIVAPIVIGCLLWAFYHQGLFADSRHHAATPPSPAPRERRPIGPRIAPSQTPDVIVLSRNTLSSVPAISDSFDPDPIASFRQLIKPPPGASQAAAHVDPRMLRRIMDRGVVTFASSRQDADRAKGASLIQIAALVGFQPARSLLARNYPLSEAVRSIVPAEDAIRYALDFFKNPAEADDEPSRTLSALAEGFTIRGDLDLFATQVLTSLRGDSQPQLSHRVDLLLESLARARGSCASLARLVLTSGQHDEQECSAALATGLRRYIETTAPSGDEAAARRRGLLLLSELDAR
jgi:hypothetical protein